ncbi:MAG: DASH family cryptochrome [Leeuwenhoekiella sp.]
MNLIWFRNDLRTTDNTGLSQACSSGVPVVAVYFFDPRQFGEDRFGFKKTEKFRARFLIETVTELRENLEQLNIPLFVYYDGPEAVIPKLAERFEIQGVYLQKEWTKEEREVVEAVKLGLNDSVAVAELYDQFLFHPEDIPYDDFPKIPEVFTQFRKKCEKYAAVREPLDQPEKLPQENLLKNDTQIPDLKTLGLEEFEQDARSAFPFRGGENQAIDRLDHYFWKTKKLQYYKKTRNGLVGNDYSSKFSAWLANGSISPRFIYAEVKRFEKEINKNQDTYWLIFELIWRDYFKYISLKHGDTLFHLGGIKQKEYDWNRSEKVRKEWINGNTKYDFVNANMREIGATGWMSNRGRQNVASFWAKEMEQDWRVGAAYFESLLIDYDVHSNYGNWMYNSGVGNDPRDRKFNIKSQADRYDADGKFQRLWLQERLL